VIIGGMLFVLLVGMVVFAVFNATIERVAYKPLRHAPRLAPLITAVGMSFIVQNIALAFYDVNYRTVPQFIPRTNVFEIGGVSYTWTKLAAILIVVPLLVLLSWFVTSTKQGKAMRAVAQDTEASAMMGIDVNRNISMTFLIAGALAGAAAIVYLLQFNMRYDTGFELGLIAFTAAVLGGIGNLTGAVFGAVLIGLIQACNEGLTWLAPGRDWTRSIVFGILIMILVFRPEGLLGERTPEGA
jgi:branched-chain amino acid transport system permease protein